MAFCLHLVGSLDKDRSGTQITDATRSCSGLCLYRGKMSKGGPRIQVAVRNSNTRAHCRLSEHMRC